jgi:hypothetical protein
MDPAYMDAGFDSHSISFENPRRRADPLYEITENHPARARPAHVVN